MDGRGCKRIEECNSLFVGFRVKQWLVLFASWLVCLTPGFIELEAGDSSSNFSSTLFCQSMGPVFKYVQILPMVEMIAKSYYPKKSLKQF